LRMSFDFEPPKTDTNDAQSIFEEEDAKSEKFEPAMTPAANGDPNDQNPDQPTLTPAANGTFEYQAKPNDNDSYIRSASGDIELSQSGTKQFDSTITATNTASSDLFDRETENDEDDEEDKKSCVGMMCGLCLLLVLCAVGAWWFNRSFTHSTTKDKHSNYSGNPDYPECNEETFNKLILPMIHLGSSERMKKQQEDWKLRHDKYDMSVDPANVANVVDHIEDEKMQLVLIFGAIKEHVGTVQLFEAIEKQLSSKGNTGTRRSPGVQGKANTTTWIYDLMDLTAHNGSVQERTMCLFQRAQEWTQKHPEERLLVALDHISQPNDKENRGGIWSELSAFKQWKQRKEWTLFVVESDPKTMIVDGENWGKRVFDTKKEEVTTISIPFIGGVLFEGVMRSLTENNPSIITMGYGEGKKENGLNTGEDTEKWMKLREITRGFTVDDTYDLYHNAIRMKANELEEQNGKGITLKMDDVLELATDQKTRTQFDNAMVDRMDVFAKSVGQTIYYSDFKGNFGKRYYSSTVNVKKELTETKGKNEKGKQNQGDHPKGVAGAKLKA